MWFLWQQSVVLPWRQVRRLPYAFRLSFCLLVVRRLFRCLAYLAEGRLARNERRDGSNGFVVILLNFARPWNIDPMVRVFLKSGCVDVVVVCNNNPRWRAEKIAGVRSPRLVLIDRPTATKAGYRFELARMYRGCAYLAVDDDTFLDRRQVRLLLLGFRRSFHSPCGTQGAVYVGSDRVNNERIMRMRDWPFRRASQSDTTLDLLNAVYVFGQDHVERYFELCALLGIRDQASFGNGEDIILSHCGQPRPTKIEVGRRFRCISSGMPGIAVSANDRLAFFDERWRLFCTLRGIGRKGVILDTRFS